jgi:hypothetical protein
MQAPFASVRLEIVRIGAPLWIVGFMSGRIAHADEWISSAGFRLDDFGGGWEAPLYVPGIPPWAAWTVAGVLVASALLVSVGWKTRVSASVLFVTLTFVALADQISSFTVTKIGPVITLALAVSPAGKTLSVDAWRKQRAGGGVAPRTRPIGAVRFYQLFLAIFYSAAGIAKARGDWLRVPNVLFSHLHGDYQTAATVLIGTYAPTWVWTPLQWLVLAFEVFAPVWFALRRTRPYAIVFAVGMHVMIAVMFGPVLWFSLLMITLVLASFLPDGAMDRIGERLEPGEPPRPSDNQRQVTQGEPG